MLYATYGKIKQSKWNVQNFAQDISDTVGKYA